MKEDFLLNFFQITTLLFEDFSMFIWPLIDYYYVFFSHWFAIPPDFLNSGICITYLNLNAINCLQISLNKILKFCLSLMVHWRRTDFELWYWRLQFQVLNISDGVWVGSWEASAIRLS